MAAKATKALATILTYGRDGSRYIRSAVGSLTLAGAALLVELVASAWLVRIRIGRWIVLALVLVGIGWFVSAVPRLQRFETLSDPSTVETRLHGSVNADLIRILTDFPLGNGLGGGGEACLRFPGGPHPRAGRDRESIRFDTDRGRNSGPELMDRVRAVDGGAAFPSIWNPANLGHSAKTYLADCLLPVRHCLYGCRTTHLDTDDQPPAAACRMGDDRGGRRPSSSSQTLGAARAIGHSRCAGSVLNGLHCNHGFSDGARPLAVGL